MSSVSERPPKRRRDEIDEKIEGLSKVINTMSGSKKSILQAKLCNIKLKKQKLIALSFCRSHEPSKQNLVTEYDMMIAENDIDIEIESIRSSKRFKRSEDKYLERLFRDPNERENRVYNSSPIKASTSDNTSAEISNPSKENTPHNCRQNLSNTPNSVIPMCDKSTNTEPMYILKVPNVKQTMPPLDGNKSSMDETVLIVEENLLPNQSMPPLEDSLSPFEGNVPPLEVNVSPVEENVSLTEVNLSPIKENVSVMEGNLTQFKENLLPTGEYTFLHSSEHGFVQSKWFETSFEMDHFLNEKPEVEQQSETYNVTDTVSKIPEREHKQQVKKSYQRKNEKKHKAKEYSASRTSKEIITRQNLSDSTPVPIGKKSGKDNTENTTNVAFSATALAITSTPMVLSEATIALPEVAVALPDSTYGALSEATRVASERPKKKIALPEATLAMPKASMALSEASHSHKTIANLFGSYKQIYSSEKVNNKYVNQYSGRNDINNNSDDKKLLADTHYLKMAAKCDGEAIAELLQQNTKSSTKKSKDLSKKSHYLPANSKDMSTKSHYLPAKPKGMPTKSQDLPANSKDLSIKSQHLSAKSKDMSTKSEDPFAKLEDLLGQYKYFPAQYQDTAAKPQDLPAKSKDSFSKSQYPPDFSTKSKDLSTKSLDKSKDLSTKSKDLSTKSLHKSKDLSTRSPYLPAKSKDMSTRSPYLPAKSKDMSTKSKGSSTKKALKTSKTDRYKEKIESQKSSHSNVYSEENAILSVRRLFKMAMEKNAVYTISQEDLVNDLFKDLMASKRIKPRTDTSSDKTASCQTCGLVYEGHMCADTIREIIEQC